jgi:hypothetical protein
MILNLCPVRFDQGAHTYTTVNAEPKQLSGVTSLLSRQIFPNKYGNVPDFVLKRAAERGTKVHEYCELYFSLGVKPDNVEEQIPEAEALFKEVAERGWEVESTEYLVSDLSHVASSIDAVFSKEGKALLCDIKTTYELDELYLRWQLSIYAYLFEDLNPSVPIGALYALWLRGGKAEIIEVERIPAAVCRSLIEADAEGRQFEIPAGLSPEAVAKASKDTLPAKYQAMVGAMREIEEQAKYWEEQRKTLLAGIKAEMDKAGVSKWESPELTLTRRADSVRKTFDSKRFQKEHPDIYGEYITESVTSGSVTMKFN